MSASAAFACTTWKGTLELTGDKGGTSKSLGKGAGMQHCPGSPTGYTNASTNGGTVVVKTSPVAAADQTANCPPSQLNAGEYDVNYLNGAAFTGDLPTSYRNWLLDCMSGSPGARKIGQTTVASNGTNSPQGPFPLDDPSKSSDDSKPNALDPTNPSKPLDESAVCVSSQSPRNAYGNQGPITIRV